MGYSIIRHCSIKAFPEQNRVMQLASKCVLFCTIPLAGEVETNNSCLGCQTKIQIFSSNALEKIINVCIYHIGVNYWTLESEFRQSELKLWPNDGIWSSYSEINVIQWIWANVILVGQKAASFALSAQFFLPLRITFAFVDRKKTTREIVDFFVLSRHTKEGPNINSIWRLLFLDKLRNGFWSCIFSPFSSFIPVETNVKVKCILTDDNPNFKGITKGMMPNFYDNSRPTMVPTSSSLLGGAVSYIEIWVDILKI